MTVISATAMPTCRRTPIEANDNVAPLPGGRAPGGDRLASYVGSDGIASSKNPGA